MTRSALVAALLVFAPCALVGSLLRADHEQQAETDFVWLSDLADARELAAREKKPLLIAFRCVP